MNQIKQYYDNLIGQDHSEAYALQRTAAVFRISLVQVKRALKRVPKPRVRKPKPQRQ